MDRKTLITYAFYYAGEYNRIYSAIRNRKHLTCKIPDNAITILDDIYPKELLDLKYPPFVLFYKGDLSLLKRKKIAVVGSRIPCDYALKATQGLVNHHNDKVIVSGLAKGIDGQAHRFAKNSIGVLGCGIDYIYPRCNYDLYKLLEKDGLILSEYPSFVKPLAYHFPIRNRIIAALSDTLYVMQSGSKSGTLTSVNEALELSREVKVLPYNAFDTNGIQNNILINEGASLILNEEIAF